MDRPDALIQLLPASLQWSRDGDVRVAGRRIALFDILNAHHELGKPPELIAEEYELSLELIRDVLGFAERHPAEVAAYMGNSPGPALAALLD
ncbi:MAG: hypothetical protein ACLQIB_01855 [Isosphaeraceae bacterium]